MNQSNKKLIAILFCSVIVLASCKTPALAPMPVTKTVPATYATSTDTTNRGIIPWQQFFTDKYLTVLIDTALKNNQELAIALQEIEIARNDIRLRKGQLLPSIKAGGGIGVEKVGLYTSQGAGDASTEIKPGKEVPEWLPDYRIGATAGWEVDIWNKLHNATKASVDRYLATAEGRKFVVTNLIAEIANSYYELLALDNQLEIVQQTIRLQQNALAVVRIQKQAAAANELAVKKFEAEVLNSQCLVFDLQQKIKEKENAINFLAGRYPQPIARDTSGILNKDLTKISSGIPSQLLNNRPDIQQAELELSAAKLDVQVAKAEFYPSFKISAGLGLQAFNPTYIARLPESILFSLAGDVAGPLINKNAIKAEYYSANARQLQAVYNYERSILNAYIEVSTELSNMQNLGEKYDLKSKQVETLVKSVDISNDLFKAARADYLEVLLTQRDALESKLELIETKLHQFNSITNIYRSLGGGWK